MDECIFGENLDRINSAKTLLATSQELRVSRPSPKNTNVKHHLNLKNPSYFKQPARPRQVGRYKSTLLGTTDPLNVQDNIWKTDPGHTRNNSAIKGRTYFRTTKVFFHNHG